MSVLLIFQIIWTAPNTLIGLLVGVFNLLTGGRLRWRLGAVECSGGIVKRLFAGMPNRRIVAMTLGHVILGIHEEALESVTNHERVHVRQYERWGIFFLPAYGIASLIAWRRGQDPYRGNMFEVEAYKVKG
ncbi:MAG TPA: hypothetical protein DDW52_25570 [Planctomycetaceae bacterium]|nr:hypothetical protein [Planctomycetaceae bacterium]